MSMIVFKYAIFKIVRIEKGSSNSVGYKAPSRLRKFAETSFAYCFNILNCW